MKKETSKKILIFCDALAAAATVASFAALFLGHDLSGVAEIDRGIYALAGAAHSFYFWKAKAENLKKYGQKDKITMSEGENSYE